MINGIVLAGGLSSRFGSCKSKLEINNESILKNTFELLSNHCEKVFVSCREESKIENYPCLFDEFEYFAPICGIYTALKYFNSPLFVLSCDLPFMDNLTITNLIDERNIAVTRIENLEMTTYKKKKSEFIEALVAIYEPKALFSLNKAIEMQRFSLTKAIAPENRHHIIMENENSFFNINYPKDLEEARAMKN